MDTKTPQPKLKKRQHRYIELKAAKRRSFIFHLLLLHYEDSVSWDIGYGRK